MTDDELVASELAYLDEVAKGLSEAALNAYVRAYAIRRVPVSVAAAVLRSETLDALAGKVEVPAHWASVTWRMESRARRLRVQGWSRFPMEGEIRVRARMHHDFKAASKAARLHLDAMPRDGSGRLVP